jgi:hypothetical protein
LQIATTFVKYISLNEEGGSNGIWDIPTDNNEAETLIKWQIVETKALRVADLSKM